MCINGGLNRVDEFHGSVTFIDVIISTLLILIPSLFLNPFSNLYGQSDKIIYRMERKRNISILHDLDRY